MRVGIIGLGHVGRNMERRFAQLGVPVVVYDLALHEEYPYDDLRTCDFAVVCVGTPSRADGSADVDAVHDAVAALPVDRVLLRSTVPPGTTDEVARKTGKDVCFSPEYVGETPFTASRWATWAQDELFWVLGGPPETTRWFADRLTEIHGPEPRVHQCSAVDAEIVKYMENSYFALKVTFVNEFYELCQRAGADWHAVREGWLADPRVERDHTAVLPRQRGYAGRCLPKDVDALLAAAADRDLSLPLMAAVREANTHYRARSETGED